MPNYVWSTDHLSMDSLPSRPSYRPIQTDLCNFRVITASQRHRNRAFNLSADGQTHVEYNTAGSLCYRFHRTAISLYYHFQCSMLLLARALLSLLNEVPTLFQILPTPTTGLVDRIESRVPPTIAFSHKGLNADEYVFARRWTIRGHRSRPICLADTPNKQYIINGSNGSATTISDWRRIGVRMRKQSNRWQRSPASRYSATSGEVGRKFRDLIQDEKVERRDR